MTKSKEEDIAEYLKAYSWVSNLRRSFWVIMSSIFMLLFCGFLLLSVLVNVDALGACLVFSSILSFFISHWVGAQLWERAITPEVEELDRLKRLLKYKYGLLMEFK